MSLPDIINSRLYIDNAFIDIKLPKIVKCLLPFFWRLVGDINAGLDTPKQVWNHGKISLGCIGIGQVAHDLVDAKNFLNHHQSSAVGLRRLGNISRECAIWSVDRDMLAHMCILRKIKIDRRLA